MADLDTLPKVREFLRGRRTSTAVNTDDLHPIAAYRVALMIAEFDRVHGARSLLILSGVRTYAQQVALYRQICLVERRCGYVANPDIVQGETMEGVLIKGSRHQAASDGYGRAVDLAQPAVGWAPVHAMMRRFGLDLTVRNPYEPWHFEAGSRQAWFTGPWPEPGFRVLGSRMVGGDVVALQRQLGVAADGIIGPGTVAAIRARQERLGVTPDGRWGPATQRAHLAAAAAVPPIDPCAAWKDAAQQRKALLDEVERLAPNAVRRARRVLAARTGSDAG